MSFVKPSSKSVPAGSFVNSGSFAVNPNLLAANSGSFTTGSGSFAVGSLSKLSASSSNARSQDPHKIKFAAGWRKGDTEDWYQQQLLPGRSTIFKSLEYRKEREAPFYHEFVVVDLGNNTVCRFDRRGDINNRANVLVGEPIPSEDTAHIIAKSDKVHYSEIENNSDLLLTMKFPQGQDLLKILAVCYGIQANKNTQAYSLTRYNCYFFSWMIITASARCTVDWALLAQESSLWEALVTSVMNGLDQDPGPGPKTAIPAALISKKKDDALVPTRFVGSAYLFDTLRKALGETRKQIQTSLSELILHSTVDNAMREVSETSAQKAASQAARSHAAQAARDAAMEAVIETMWRDIISHNEGGNLWERKCKLAEDCVREASAAAAEVEGQIHRVIVPPPETPVPESNTTQPPPEGDNAEPIPAPPAKWEAAWEAAWEKTWSSTNDSGRQRSNTNGSGNNDSSNINSNDPSKTSISDRAKAAWIKAWKEACQANEQYVPLISGGVADYVTKNLPEALPEVLTYETDENVLKTMVKALIPTKGSSNAELQKWVKARIMEHCQRVIRMTAGAQQPNQAEFEGTMKGVWESTLSCLPDIARCEKAIKA